MNYGIYSLAIIVFCTCSSVADVPPCDEDLIATDTPQNLTSPNYPNKYHDNMRCQYNFRAKDPSKRIQILGSGMNIASTWSTCKFGDALRIYNGKLNPDKFTPNYSIYCGNDTSVAFQSKGDTATAVFKTDRYDTWGTGFNLQYSQTTDNLPCNQVITLDPDMNGFKIIKYPEYPWYYTRNNKCSWLIKNSPSDKRTLQVSFNDVDILNTKDCLLEYISIYHGPSTDWPMIGRFCGNQTGYFRTSSNAIYIEFVTGNDIYNHKGFDFSYSLYDGSSSTCRQSEKNVYSSSETIKSPYYPFMYPRTLHCTWILRTVIQDAYISINVLDTNIESSQKCSADRLEFYEGTSNVSSKLIKTICGTETSTFFSSGREILIVFIANGNAITGSGFQIEYHSVKPATFSLVPAIVGGTIAGAAGVVVIVGFTWWACIKLRSRTGRRSQSKLYMSTLPKD